MDFNKIANTVDISVSGLKAQKQQLKLISSNIANAQSTDSGNGRPYRRMEAVFQTDTDTLGGVKIGQINQDSSEFPKVLKPGHPQADEQGYVAMPNVNLPIEMMNLNIASRTYQANIAVLKRYQRMVDTTLELLR